ncbi:hypothetical protein [Massilia sp. TS11]|uniref:hypothetical protein n=1 Tax=Massilia sp. TS11 TaxID=2908003 RepID=UPI001EDC4E9B|nr:hypothetical protein [Massilia sp. TS11]MCG2585695.1 hypothetical protein [Massilia sp. TS11]
MLQNSEIQQRITRIEQAVGQAAQSCQTEQNLSPKLKHCIEELDRQCHVAESVIQSQDENRIRQCVDELESLGDEAKRACTMDGSAPSTVKDAVLRAHDELSRLKHQLH